MMRAEQVTQPTRVFMSDGNPQNGSIWPVVTIIVAIVALGTLGWDVMLQGRVKKMEERVAQIEHNQKAAAAATPKSGKTPAVSDTRVGPAPVSSRRRRGATTRPATTQPATQPAAKSTNSQK
jgi:hypothetical protein